MKNTCISKIIEKKPKKERVKNINVFNDKNSLSKINNKKIKFNTPLMFIKIESKNKIKNLKDIKLNEKEKNKRNKLFKLPNSNSKNLSAKKNNIKSKIISESRSKEKNAIISEDKILLKQKKIKLISNKNSNLRKANHQKHQISKENIDCSTLDEFSEYYYYLPKNTLYKSRTKMFFKNKNLYFLGTTENSSSFSKNRKNIIKNYISNNKTILSDNLFSKINKLRRNRIRSLALNYQNTIKNINSLKEVNYKNLKKNNELIKEINSISFRKGYNFKGNYNINRTKIINYSKNKDSFYSKFNSTSRKQKKIKKIIYSINKKYDSQKNKINAEESDYNKSLMNKIIILIKSNWGNLSKINFIKITFIDKNNEKIFINNANYDMNNPYVSNYNKSETKQLIFYYDAKIKIKNIEIINGFGDSGIKSIIIENEEKKIIWRGIIPKKNLISNKPYIIILSNISKFIKKKKVIKKKNISFDLDNSLFFEKSLVNGTIKNTNKTLIRTYFKENNYLKLNLKHKAINESTIKKYRKETYERDTSEYNLNQNICSFAKIPNVPSIIIPIKPIDNKYKKPNINYQLCDRIIIKLVSNYGNSKYIGLSSIEFYDEEDNLIDINSNNNYIKTNHQLNNNKQKKNLNNLFDGKNNSIEPESMFVTKKEDAFIEIDFKKKIKIKKIIIYNYNNEELKSYGTKKISLIFYKNKKCDKTIKSIYLNKGICEQGIEYGQVLKFPFNDSFGVKRYKNLKKEIKHLLLNSTIIYNKEYDYYSPAYPSGFVLKFLLMNNWGSKDYIGLEQIKLFDEENNEINLNENDNNDENSNNINSIYLIPEKHNLNAKCNPIVLTKYKNKEKKVYIIFNNLIMISKINIINYYKFGEIGVKDMKIFIDDNIIFEGTLNKNINNIYFSNPFEEESLNYEQKNIERYSEQILENGTKILSLL